TLVEYERGHRLAPLDVVEAYESELGLGAGTLAAVHEGARLELYGEDRAHLRTYVVRPALDLPHQLPPDVAGFTGREVELGRLRAVVAEGAAGTVVISAIAGTAGVGKTALAVHLAHELAPDFPDLQLYVNLHGYEPAQRLAPTQVLDRFLRALGVPPEELPSEVEEQAARYRGLLAGRRALVVLDNASSAEQVRPLLPASASCLVLVTSRDRLAGLVAAEGARVLMLDVLAPLEALDLLSRTASPARVDAEPEAASKVVRLCGHLPLAVRIAGARLATRPGMSLGALAERLSDERARLGELSAGDVGVRASLALSYQALAPEAAQMFRRLGLIPGPDFARVVAAALLERTPHEAERWLETLVDAHLVEIVSTTGRYRFHDLVRLYARERAQAEESDHDREAARRRMFEWYLDIADAAERLLIPGRRRLPHEPTGRWNEPAFATSAEALGWFDAERANLVAATHQAADLGLHSLAWQLGDASWTYFYRRSSESDWEDTHRIGLAAAREARDRQAEAWMLASLGDLGDFTLELRRSEESASAFKRSVAICREIGDREGEARALCGLGHCKIHLGQLEEAIECEQRALAISREIGYAYRQGIALNHLGVAYCDMGRLREAMDCHRQALAIRQALSDRWNEGISLNSLGRVFCKLRRFQDAIDCAKQSLAIAREVGHRWGEARSLELLGVGLCHTQGIEAACPCWEEARNIFTDLDAPQAEEEPARLAENSEVLDSNT
ncbi:MAG: tetratricopeptide repeat protein, partial [Actinobacteria bacterium]